MWHGLRLLEKSLQVACGAPIKLPVIEVKEAIYSFLFWQLCIRMTSGSCHCYQFHCDHCIQHLNSLVELFNLVSNLMAHWKLCMVRPPRPNIFIWYVLEVLSINYSAVIYLNQTMCHVYASLFPLTRCFEHKAYENLSS